MLGKSGCAALSFAILVSLSCAHNVSQDKATGPDGKIKGAKALTLENGEAKANGIVTYPGGDRVDWKMIELPEKQSGSLDIRLQWTPPRPGLQLAFDVFDEWNTIVVSSKGKKRSTSRVRTATIDGAKGKYFIRVYAANRGDAGKYKLTVDFKETNGAMAIDLTKIEIPEPPKLAAVPEAEATCDEFTFDPKNLACRTVCPAAGAPAGWPACKGKCTEPPDPTNEACWDKVCPNPMTKRSKACMRPGMKEKFPPCDRANPDPENWKCDLKDPPVVGRVIANSVQGGEVTITIAVGTDQNVKEGWTGRVLRGDSDNPLDGGEVRVIRVGKRETVGKVKLTTDQVSANPRVKLSPP